MPTARAKARLLVRRPFSYLAPDGATVSVPRGAVCPEAVLKDAMLRGRLIRCNYLYDPEHPEAMGVPTHRADRVAEELEGRTFAPVPQDAPDEVLRDERRAKRDAEIDVTRRPWFDAHAPVPDKPAAWGPDITPAVKEG
jgi:hypothetical protein